MIPVSYEVAREMFEAAPPGSPELDLATTLCAEALVRRIAMGGFEQAYQDEAEADYDGQADCEEGYSRCHECGELKADPHDFYDGLICIACVERREGVDESD